MLTEKEIDNLVLTTEATHEDLEWVLSVLPEFDLTRAKQALKLARKENRTFRNVLEEHVAVVSLANRMFR